MKKLVFIFCVLAQFGSIAQRKGDCFIQYYDLFNTYKANPVPDGVQNVVVTVRDTKENTCITYQGKIEVKANKIAGRLTLKNTRGEFVPNKDRLNKKYGAPENGLRADFRIINGMTSNFLSKEMKVVNLFFIDFLKKPDPNLVEAPPIKKP